MKEPQQLEHEIANSRENLDRIAGEISERVQHGVATAHPQRAPFPWGRWLAIATGCAAGLAGILTAWTLVRR